MLAVTLPTKLYVVAVLAALNSSLKIAVCVAILVLAAALITRAISAEVMQFMEAVTSGIRTRTAAIVAVA